MQEKYSHHINVNADEFKKYKKAPKI